MANFYIPLVASPPVGGSGGGDSSMTVSATIVEDNYVCNKTAGEMLNAAISGTPVSIIFNSDAYSCAWPVIFADSGYNFFVWNGDSAMLFSAASADDYPSAVLD